ncbi:preprotein translocase subunit SecY [Tessaracoccus lapidicaptus]|uniref:Protein translocase subunit SecY n=1 Tax=Tessaracoccus lapidicaptus TaxID=1427523 RepID=A0A1C0ASH3_9ACTN|nr:MULTISPECIES: preprotein translocase subunit SecY [Tessaracoccus]AQX16586.1 preprotein translocase subunit SecY [Tessaracoccus sp. T2.5-30]OCL37260.1 preprotein translocase subunit SecY [Tessaracoccus lapidicaptus]VEP41272.1 Protein translocase subunit SecY [Tessaracoccus lapidicaptus]
MLSALANALKTPDLRRKILFTLGIIVVFRLGSTVPSPNVNISRIDQCLALAQQGDAAGLYSMINLFSGGALLQLTIFALGIMPYITASIILQLLTVVIPRLEALKKEGGTGQQKITEYTRYLTLVLAVLNATAFVTLARTGQLFQGCDGILYSDELLPLITMVLVMTAGTGIIMWMGELITERGIGNGMSILIFTQIAASFPSGLWSIKQSHQGVTGWVLFFLVIGIGLLVMLGIIWVEQGQRRIPVQYAKRMVGRRLVGGSTTYIPLKVNQSGVIPVIFASSILYLPVLYSTFRPDGAVSLWIQQNFTGQGSYSWVYNLTQFVLIIAFCYFYVSITFNPEEVSDNMKKYGGFIPGIRAGKPTERYLAYVLSRLTAPGSLYLATIALIPTIAFMAVGAQQNFPFGGTSILIIVGVALDTVKKIESQLQQRNYEGFLR